MRWLLDEMLPRAAVDALNERGHDAVSVVDIDLRTASDDSVYATAVEQARIVVTEDENDFERILKQTFATGDAVVPVVVVRKARLGRGGAMPYRLADALHRWSIENPDPFVGAHYLDARRD